MEKKNFFRDLKAELKKVVWPSKENTIKNTVLIVFIVAIFTLLVFALDGSFFFITKQIVSNIK